MERTSAPPKRAAGTAPRRNARDGDRDNAPVYREPFEPTRRMDRAALLQQTASTRKRSFSDGRGGGGSDMHTGSRIAMYIFVIVMLALLFTQVTRLAQIAQFSKQITSLKSDIRTMIGDNSNKSVRLNMQRDINRVREEAIYKLGMIQPEEGQIRIVTMIIPSVDVQQQTAMSGG